MSHTITDRTIALAGVFQAASMVSNIASKGSVDYHDLETMVRSTLNLNPSDTIAVYGRVEYLRSGLHALLQHLGNGNTQRDLYCARYVISLLHLAKKLAKNPQMLDTISTRLEKVQDQVEMFGIVHDNVLANMAGIYADTISTLAPRIIVSGESGFLSNPQNADKIRAILLAGIRSAILWQQVGGTRLQIVFRRKQITEEARRILEHEMNRHLH